MWWPTLFERNGSMKTCVKKSFVVPVLVAVVAVLVVCPSQAQFNYTTNNGTITITGYTGTDANVVIPSTIDGLPVTSIGTNAFYAGSLTSVTIPDSVTSIGVSAFDSCINLTNVTRPNNVTNIGDYAFQYCTSLTSVTIPNSLTSIGYATFSGCQSLTNITIPNSVTNIGDGAFSECWSLTKVFFDGNAPAVGSHVFEFWVQYTYFFDPATVYYLLGTTGWSTNFAGRPTAIWMPQVQTADGSFGVKSNQFGFNVSWASGMSVVVEASRSLSSPAWSPVATNTLSGGTFYFTDPQWTKYPSRFYRVRQF
jgi:hypothetical protein